MVTKEELTPEQREIFSIVNKITGDLVKTYNDYFEQLVDYKHLVHCMQNTSMAFFMSRLEQIAAGFIAGEKRIAFIEEVQRGLYMSFEVLKMQGVRFDG